MFESTIKSINVYGKADRFNGGLIFHHWMLQVLCSKKDTWSNEREWRALGGANVSYLGPLVSAIIVGHNISKNDFNEIKKDADKNGFPIKITSIDYENQEIIIKDITQNDIDKIMTNGQ